MVADPEPEQAVVNFDGEGSVLQADASGSESSGFLEMQRRMSRVCLQQRKVPVSQLLNRGWESFVTLPETWTREVAHSSVDLPARCSALASSAS